MSSQRRNPKEIIYTFTVVAASLSVAIFLAELALRLLGLSNEIMYAPNRHYGWQHIPNTQYTHRFDGRDIDVKINSRGLRSGEIAVGDKDDRIRVLVLGDSFAEALQVAYEESFPHLIQERLNRELSHTSRSADIINAGVSGFGTDNELLYFMHEGHKYSPDIVLLAFCMCNDVRNNWMTLEIVDAGAIKKPYYSLENEHLTLNTDSAVDRIGVDVQIKLWLNLHSRIYTLAKRVRDRLRYRETVTALGMPLDYNLFRVPLTAEWEKAFEITKRLIVALDDEVTRNGARLIVAIVPTQYQVNEEYWISQISAFPPADTQAWDRDWPNEALSAFLDSNNIPHIDLLPVFRERAGHADGSGTLYFQQDGHWTPEGHDLAANALSTSILGILIRSEDRGQ